MSENISNELPVITSIDNLPETAIEELTCGNEPEVVVEKPAVKAASKPTKVEEVVEPVRKIDRMLNQLLYSNFFNMASAVVFAQFTDCGETAERNRLLRDFANRVDCPVFSGLDYGHSLPSHSFLFDEPCRIEDGAFFLQ
jgi:hypothetical protein